jgi:hypothetical protein
MIRLLQGTSFNCVEAPTTFRCRRCGNVTSGALADWMQKLAVSVRANAQRSTWLTQRSCPRRLPCCS